MSIRVARNGVTEPLIPDIAGMTKCVENKLPAEVAKLYAMACSHFKTDGLPTPNVEGTLSHIRSLKQVAGKEVVRGLSLENLTQLDDAICDVLSLECSWPLPTPTTPYHTLAAWIGAIQRVASVEVFTTNYDLLMEEALETTRVPYFDGFVGSNETFFDLRSIEEDGLPARWCRLWKIHGSLNWHEDNNGNVRRAASSTGRKVIYPSQLKYDESRRMPYLAMLDRLRSFLKKDSSVLITCGFSFRDRHLNDVILQGLQSSPTSVVFALLYGKLATHPLIEKMAQGRPNLTVMARDGGYVGARRCDWPTERDAKACVDSKAVEWLDNAAKPGTKDAQFMLGDFAALAGFIDELTGEQSSVLKP